MGRFISSILVTLLFLCLLCSCSAKNSKLLAGTTAAPVNDENAVADELKIIQKADAENITDIEIVKSVELKKDSYRPMKKVITDSVQIDDIIESLKNSISDNEINKEAANGWSRMIKIHTKDGSTVLITEYDSETVLIGDKYYKINVNFSDYVDNLYQKSQSEAQEYL